MATNTQLSAAAIQQLLVIRQELPQWGSRRPTSYPEWVTLEVAHGGFATGRAQASFELDKARKRGDAEAEVRSNQAFLTEEGLQELAGMLDSGRYQIEFPENSAFLVLVHLLRQDRVQDARELMQELAPYIDDIRFYPTATNDAPSFSPYKVGVTDVGTLKRMLSSINDTAGKRGNTQIHHRDGCDLYEPIQAQAIKLLLASAGTALTTKANNNKLLLTQISEDLKAEMKALITRYWVINPVASQTVMEVVDSRTARVPHPVSKHTRNNATTRVLIEAMCSVFNKKPLNDGELSLVGNRIRRVIAKRGVLGTPKHDEEYRARVELSSALSGNNKAVAMAAIAVLDDEKRGDQTFINEADTPALNTKILSKVSSSSSEAEVSSTSTVVPAPRLYHGGSSTGLPTVVASGISRTTARTIEEHIQAGIINSAEMIADVVPMLSNAAASNKIQDPILRSLYCSLAVAFSRRRSLLLVDLSSQVRLDELPWAKPMLAGLQGGSSSSSDVVATIDTIRIATRSWIDHFPYTMTPNRFVSSIKAVMRGLKGLIAPQFSVMASIANATTAAATPPQTDAIKMPRLLEELASDIFMGSFSSNFSLSTLQAARFLQGTIYERYYNIGPIYADLITRLEAQAARTGGGRNFVTAMSGILLNAATNCMSQWKVPADNGRINYTVANGRTLEAVMVMSTHNLCQLYAWLDLGSASPSEGGVDNMAAVRKTWKHIIGLFESPPEDTYYGYRMVAYAWRQLLFFLSMEEKRLTHADDADSIRAFRATMGALCDEMKQTIGTAKLADSISTRLNTKFIDVLRKVAVEGKVNSMDDIQKPDAEKGCAHGDVVLGYFSWSMFKE